MSEKTTQTKQFWMILLIVFLGFLGISMPYLIFPALFFNPDYAIVPDAWENASRAIFLGITLAAYPLGQFFGSPILGALSDDYGRKPLLTGSLLLAGLSHLLSGWAIAQQHLGWLIFSRLIAGLMEGNIAIARAMASDLKHLSKHETFGRINAAASIAFLIGPLLGGMMTDTSISEQLTPSTPFYVIFCLFAILACFCIWFVQEPMMITFKEKRPIGNLLNIPKRLSSLFVNQQLKFLLMMSTCFTLAVDIFYEFGPVYLTVKWALAPSDLVIFNAGLCLGLVLGNGWLPQWTSKLASKQGLILSSIAAFALILILIVQTNSMIFMFLMFSISGLFIGLAVTLITVKISNSVEDTLQGEVMGVQLSLRVLGDAIICLLGGVLLLLSSKIILLFAALLATSTFVLSRKKLHHHV